MQHPSGLNDRVVAKVVARRGRLHAHEHIDAKRTALVVIDLNAGSVAQNENCQDMVPRVNTLAHAIRVRGGLVAWVTSHFEATPSAVAIYGTDAARFVSETSNEAAQLWPDLHVEAADVHAVKRGASAFFPGKCDLHEKLAERNIDTLLICGTVTNVCVESSARDAAELGYRVTLISDACSGHANGLHEATLNTFYRCFGDVRPTADAISLLEESRAAA